MKKSSRISIFLIGTVIVAGVLYSFAAIAKGIDDSGIVTTFSDVTATHPNAKAIIDLKNRGVISGYPDGSFKPDQTVNRAEALKIILLGSGISVETGLKPLPTGMKFNDIEPGAWYSNYVTKAYMLGIVEGYPDRTFRPYQAVNLVENLKILLTANKIDLGSILVFEDPYKDAFKDQWYGKYVAYAKAKNLIDADLRNMVFPARDLTRAKLAEIMYRFYLQFKPVTVDTGFKPLSTVTTDATTTTTATGTTTSTPSAATGSTAASGATATSTTSTTPTPPPSTTTTSTPLSTAPLGPLACKTANTLDTLIVCIMDHFGPFLIPTSAQQADFRAVVKQMLNKQCDNITIPSGLIGIYNIRTFTDSENSKSYCLLIESGDKDNDGKIDNGWGTFIVNNNPARELNIAITHPIDDSKTEYQGINVFKGTDSRTFLLAGATRNLGGTSTCDNGYETSDAAHNIANLFWPATQEIDAWYGSKPWTQLQLHGMAVSTCPGVDMFISQGTTSTPKPDDTVLKLKANLQKYFPKFSVTVMGDTPECGLTATGNTEGRYLNNPAAPDYCAVSSKIYTQKFIHIEQAPDVRKSSEYGGWINAIKATWP